MAAANFQSLYDDLLDRFMAALNTRDSAAMDAWHHGDRDYKRINRTPRV